MLHGGRVALLSFGAMQYSFSHFDTLIQGFLKSHLALHERIVDVGPGTGKFSDLLGEYSLDAIEIYTPYIDQWNLRQKYKKIHICHIADFDFAHHGYQTYIFGDVLEHLSVHEAQKVLSGVFRSGARAFVAVPYLYEQGDVRNNQNERHLQPDLTPDLVLQRYSSLHLLHRDQRYGLYTGPTDWVQRQETSFKKRINHL